jgi:CBS domain-containing protein
LIGVNPKAQQSPYFSGRRQGARMKAADVMTRQVITISADASILQAARPVLQNRINGLPVVDRQGHDRQGQ